MQPRISSVVLTERIAQNGFPDAVTATLVAHATLRALGERLTDDEARALTEALAPDLADLVDRSEYEGDFESAEFLFECPRADEDACRRDARGSRRRTACHR
jgi:uncharacterized protein (DUF2267 family)